MLTPARLNEAIAKQPEHYSHLTGDSLLVVATRDQRIGVDGVPCLRLEQDKSGRITAHLANGKAISAPCPDINIGYMPSSRDFDHEFTMALVAVDERAAQVIEPPTVFAGEVIWVKQWVDDNGTIRPASDANGCDHIPINITNGARELSLDVDNVVVYRGDTPDGCVVWQDEDGEGCFWIFDPRTAVLKQTFNAPANLRDMEGVTKERPEPRIEDPATAAKPVRRIR